MENLIEKKLREKARAAIAAKGLTQSEIAKIAGLHRVHVNKMLNGHSGYFPDSWTRLLEALGLDVEVVEKVKRGQRRAS